MEWLPRLATRDDIPALESLIYRSSHELQRDFYSVDQIDAWMKPGRYVTGREFADAGYAQLVSSKQLLQFRGVNGGASPAR